MKMLMLGFVAVMGLSSATNASPILGPESQELGYLPFCPPGYRLAEAYVNGRFVGWKCVPKVEVPTAPVPAEPQ